MQCGESEYINKLRFQKIYILYFLSESLFIHNCSFLISVLILEYTIANLRIDIFQGGFLLFADGSEITLPIIVAVVAFISSVFFLRNLLIL